MIMNIYEGCFGGMMLTAGRLEGGQVHSRVGVFPEVFSMVDSGSANM